MTDQKAMKLALEALEKIGLRNWVERKEEAIAALRQALEQPEQPQFFYGQDPNVLPASDKGESRE